VCKEGTCPAEYTAENLHLVNIVKKERTEEARRLHHDMGLVEWWIIANAHWLVVGRSSNFPVTAGMWGLGPGGRMERYDHGGSLFRVDWQGGECKETGAFDSRQAERCPNL
jgi:hypothetical protein